MPSHSVQEIKQALETEIDKAGDDLIRDTVKLISFETVSGGNAEQEKKYRQQIPACFEWLKTLAEENGLAFQVFDGECGEIEWRIEPEEGEGKRPVFGIASHIDVVTPAGNWTHDPFSGKIEDGVLFGRGIQDDKGPLMQSLYGIIAAKRAGIRPPCDVRIIIGTREETGDWTDIANYLEKRGAPDYSFTPDADFPIITGEKGMMNIRFTASWDPEGAHPETGMQFVGLRGGDRTNIVPGLAEAILRFPIEAKNAVMKEMIRETTRYTVENPKANITLQPNNDEESETQGYYQALLSFIGAQAHSSTPDAGYNALNDALKFFADIETIPGAVRAFIQFLAFAGAESDGANLGIDSTHDFVGATTSIITLAQVGPAGGWGSFNIRPTEGLDTETVLARAGEVAKAFSDTTGLEIAVEPNGKRLNATYLDPELPGVGSFLHSLKLAYEAVLGHECKQLSIGGTTYAKALPNCCAFGPVLLGVDEALAHQADERMAVDSIKRNALIYGLSVALMGKAEE